MSINEVLPAETHLLTGILDEALHRRRWRLGEHRPDNSPGAYLLFLNCPQNTVYGRGPEGLVGTGCLCIYAGSTDCLRSRDSAHQRTFRRTRDLSPGDIYCLSLPTEGVATARLCEQLLIDALRPLWNDPILAGVGSRGGGRRTAQQLKSPFSRLHFSPMCADRRAMRALAAERVDFVEATSVEMWPRL